LTIFSLAGVLTLFLQLKSARSDAGTHNELAQNLQAQIRVLEAEVTSAKENLEALRVSTSSEASEAAMADRDALLKARADIKVFEDGAELLKANYAKAIQEAESQVKELQEKAALAVELSVQVAHLKEEKEENAGKLSELEIEILELKESQEVVEDERERSFAHVKSLEEQLVKEVAAAHQAEEEFKTKEADRATEFEKIENAHRQALQAASEEQDKLTSALEALRVELANSQAAQDEIDAKAQAAVKEHALNLEQAEQAYVQKQGELMEEIKRITTELEVIDTLIGLFITLILLHHRAKRHIIIQRWTVSRKSISNHSKKPLNEQRYHLRLLPAHVGLIIWLE
jgi:DNA repair exonuclease SbcCD ATPase subunit